MEKKQTYFFLIIITIIFHSFSSYAQCPELTSATLDSPDCTNGTTSCDVCAGDFLNLNAEGVNLPNGGTLDWYYSTTPTFNPYFGQGTYMGSSNITNTAPPPCTDCPYYLGHLIDACGPEEANEFMVLWSGSGFAVDNLEVDFAMQNNGFDPNNEDINIGGFCDWADPAAGLIGCGSEILAGPGDNIPPNALVIIFTSQGVTSSYDFSSICGLGVPIYVMQNSCTRTIGAFSNGSSSGTRTSTISLSNCGCSDSITYDTDNPAIDPSSNGDFAFKIPIINLVSYFNAGCGIPTVPSLPPNSDEGESIVTPFSYQVPQDLCDGGPYYVIGILNPAPTPPCAQEMTAALPFNVLCPTATPASLEVCDTGLGVIIVNLTEANNDVNGFSGEVVNWFMDPAGNIPIAAPGSVIITGNTTFYASVGSGPCVSDLVPVDVTVLTGPTVDNSGFSVNPTTSCGMTNVEIIFDLPTGTPYTVTLSYGNAIDGFTTWTQVVLEGVPYIFTVNATTEFQLTMVADLNCSSSFAPPISETVDISEPPLAFPFSLELCSDGTGFALFDLESNNEMANGNTGEPVNWFLDASGVIPVGSPSNFFTSTTTVYAVVGSAPCFSDPTPVNLNVLDLPLAFNSSLEACDLGNGSALFDLSSIEFEVDGGAGNSVNWYSDASLNTSIFDPANFVSTGGIVYATTSNGTCTSESATVDLTVLPATEPMLLTASICQSDGLYDLTSLQDPNFPLGTWSGTNVSGSLFDPFDQDGDVELTFTPEGGCSQASTTTITVGASQTPMLGTAQICVEDGPYDLTQLLDPAFPNGTWSGDGVNGNFFSPDGNLGDNEITFTANGTCSNPVTTNIEVNEAVLVIFSTTLCDGEVFTINGVTFDEDNDSGSTTFINGSSVGCDSTVVVFLDFFDLADTLINDTLCVGGFLEINGEIYDEDNPTGSVLLSTVGSNGCDSLINIDLSFHTTPDTVILQTLCTGGFLDVNGTIFDETTPSGMVVIPNSDVNGCDSIVNVSLTFNDVVSFDLNQTLCPGDSIVVNGVTFNQANSTGSTTFTQGSVLGCDSIVNVNLSFNQNPDTLIQATLCTGGSLNIDGNIFDETTPSGFFIVPNGGSNGCDSIVNVELTFNDEVVFNLNQSLCPTDSIVVNGVTFNFANNTGSTTFINGSVFGCDSIVNVNLSFFEEPDTLIQQNLCFGESLDINGTIFDQNEPSGTVVFNNASTNGCDSIVMVDLSFDSEIVFNLNQSLCPGQSITINGEIFDEDNDSGSTTFINGSQSGCDSTIIVALDFFEIPDTLIQQTLCSGSSIDINGTIFDEASPSGSVTIANSSSNGCDSIVNVDLIFVEEIIFNLNETLCPGGSIIVNGETFDASSPSGSTTFTNGSQAGCDSTVVVELNFFETPDTLIEQTLCTGGSLNINGTIFDETMPSGSVTIPLSSSNGCDSIVNVNLNFNDEVTFVLNETLCPGGSIEINGVTFDEDNDSGSTTFINGSVLGCDSTVIIFLDFYEIPESTLAESICPGESIDINGTIFDENMLSGTVVIPNSSINGCDSIVMVQLDLNTIPSSNFNTVICPGESILVEGVEFNEAMASGSVVIDNGASNGCDSIIEVNVLFYQDAESLFEQTLCPGESIVIEGTTFDEDSPTGSVVIPMASSNGCDSTIMVNLSFEDDVVYNLNETLCPGGSITINGMNYDENNTSGIETFPNAGANGCDSIVNVQINFFPPAQSTISSTLNPGESLTVGGETFDSNTPNGTVVLPNASVNGCDSTIIVNLEFIANITFEYALSSPNCPGDENGSITISNIEGGQSPYTIFVDGIVFGEFDTFPVTIDGLATNDYEITIEDLSENEQIEIVTIPAPFIPILDLGEDISIRRGESVQIDPLFNFIPSSWKWEPSNYLSCDTCFNPIAIPPSTTDYILTGITEEGCVVSDQITILVEDGKLVFAPNIFSPNDDGFNDIFFIQARESIQNIKEFAIFNRWGSQIFALSNIPPNDQKHGWDGTFNGKIVDSGVYVFFAEYELEDGSTEIIKGDVTVVR